MGILRSALGHNEVTDDFSRANAVGAFSFGTSIGPESVNAELADTGFLLATDNRKLFVDKNTYGAMWLSTRVSGDETVHEVDLSEKKKEDLDRILKSQPLDRINLVDVPISKVPSRSAGSWGMLKFIQQTMKEHGEPELNLIIVAQAHHVGRVAMQARKLGINPLIPAGLPRRFDRRSKQLWTRDLGFWVPYELLGSLELKRRGQL